MNPTARISLLLGALVLLVFGIVCLKQQFGPSVTSPAFVTPGSDASAGSPLEFSAHQPTIFSAELNGGQDLDTSPRMREVSPVPLDGPSTGTFEFPVNTTRPDAPREVFSVPNLPEVTTPSQSDFPAGDSSAPRPFPVEIDQPAAALRNTAEIPTSVTTTADDSLWLISERVYGRGDYYKALFLHNQALLPRPDRIAAGIQLSIPSLESLHQQFPDACPAVADLPDSTRGE